MTTPIDVLLALLVFVASASIDFASARYVRAVGRLEARRAATWSVIQWGAGLVGFLVAFKYSLWMLPMEGLGLFVGTMLSFSHLERTRAASPRVDS